MQMNGAADRAVFTAERMDGACFGLLRDWCDALLALQVRQRDASLFGGVLCPACGMIHGRCHEAAYPMLYMADRTGEEKYLKAALRLFDWGENVVLPEGAVANDLKSDWKGVTAFAAVSLHDALFYHGGLLGSCTRARWEKRLSAMGGWLYRELTVGAKAYINYYAANACALSLLGNYFGRDDYLRAADALAEYCFSHVSENGLLYGECVPHEALSAKGCRGIDIGYNAEESLPSLTRYAFARKNADACDRCAELFHALLLFMLPDGAWDDSFGARAFKWTYWGSRTADGATDALLLLGRTRPVFAEAALRNLMLLRRHTARGLLQCGADYGAAAEPVCVHHTLCHAKTLASSLNAGLYGFERAALPTDEPTGTRY